MKTPSSPSVKDAFISNRALRDYFRSLGDSLCNDFPDGAGGTWAQLRLQHGVYRVGCATCEKANAATRFGRFQCVARADASHFICHSLRDAPPAHPGDACCMNRSVARSLGRSLGRLVDRSLDRSIARSLGRLLHRSLNRSVARSVLDCVWCLFAGCFV